VPRDVPLWDWLFLPEHNPHMSLPESQIAGYMQNISKERISFSEVKTLTTYVSTALCTNYGLQADKVIAMFSQNSVWFPVAMFAAVRVGEHQFLLTYS
jgi:4-coumarate--CoA ligase